MPWTILPFELSQTFGKAAGGLAMMVHTGHYAVLTPDAPEDYLATGNTLVCAGVALLPHDPADNIGMMHLYSAAEHFEAGQQAAQAHAAKGWQKFAAELAPKGAFTAIAFGGRKPDAHEKRFKDYTASTWLNDGLMESIQQAGFIKTIDDLRYRDANDVIIARRTQQVIIGEQSRDILKTIRQLQYTEKAKPIYNAWTIPG